MNLKVLKGYNHILHFVSAVLAFIYIYYFIQPELFYFAQQPPFQANKYFLIPYLSYPGGLLEYFSLFYMQYFFYNSVGTILIMALLILLGFSAYKIFGYLTNKNYLLFLMYLPVILLIALISNYYFSFIVALNIVLINFFLLFSIPIIKKDKYTGYVYFVLATILYYIAGGAGFIIYSICYIALLLWFKGFKTTIMKVITIVVFAVGMPYLMYKVVFNIPISKAYFEYITANNTLVKNYVKNIFFYSFFFATPIIIIGRLIVYFYQHKFRFTVHESPFAAFQHSNQSNQSKKSSATNNVLLLTYGVILVLAVIAVNANFNKHKNNIVKADFYCAGENWEKTISIIKSDPEYDILFNFYYNRAIDNSGQYLDKYFDYPQLIGPTGTFPDEVNYELMYMYYSDCYFDLGNIAESQHWAMNMFSVSPYSPRVLKRLVFTNLIMGEYTIAEKYLSILNDNILSDSFVKQYTLYVNDTSLVEKDKMMATKRLQMPKNLITPIDMHDRLMDLLEANKQNQRAYEHMQMNSLLNHDLAQFYINLPLFSNYYQSLPKVFEDALFIMGTKKKLDVDYKFRNTSVSAFKSFWGIYKTYGANTDEAKARLKNFKNTLYYYMLFDSPKVTNYKIVKTKNNEYAQ